MKRKKWIVSLSLLMGLSYAVANRSADPLYLAAQKLSSQADSVFRMAGYCSTCTTDSKGRKVKKGSILVEYFGDDNRVSLNEKAYQDLIANFQSTRKILEQGFEERQDGEIGKGKLKFAAMAADLYLVTQRRLYLNYLRNLHQAQSVRPSDLSAITSLNLHMKSSTALTLYFDDKQYQARFNLWHVKSASGSYDTIEYGMTPQDLATLEQQALQQVPTELNYGRLLQFMVSRERMTNQWALNRMNGSAYDSTQYASCATNSQIASFHGLGHGDYYQNLWSNDRADELLSLKKPIAQSTHGIEPISEAKLREVLMAYFHHWPDYTANILPLIKPESIQNYKEETPRKALAKIEDAWQKDAEHAIMDINFPSDAWDKPSVADRVAWASFHYREKHLVDLLVNEATAQGILDVTNDQKAAWTYAESKISQAMEPGREAFLNLVRAKVIAVLDEHDSLDQVAKHRTARFDETLKQVEPGMERVAQADYVTRNILEALRTFKDSWTRSGLLLRGGKDYELAYVSSRGALRDRVKLYTPDQLSQFFMKKLYYWDGVGGLFQTAGVGPNWVSDVATDIKKNRVVMHGVQQFLGALADRYYQDLKSMGPEGAHITPENSPLYHLIPEVATASYAKFAQSLIPAERPHVKLKFVAIQNQPYNPNQARRENTNVVHPLFAAISDGPVQRRAPVQYRNHLEYTRPTMARDATYVRPVQLPMAPKPVSNVVPEKKRKETLELYVEAMALMNLGELSQGQEAMVPRREAPFDKNFFRITSPLDMEHVLNEQGQERSVAERLTRSLLDQRMAAEIIKKQMLDEYPLLAIRDSNEVSASRLGDKLVNFYSPGNLDFSKTRTVSAQAIRIASINSRGLVEESCSSDPSNKENAAFKRVFDASKNQRSEIIAMDHRFDKYDESYRLAFRSNWEKFKDDWMDPLCTIVMVATTIALAWYLAPIILGGISSMIALESFSLSAFTAGAGSIAQAAGATGVKALFATLLTGKASMLVNGIFLVQALVWGHVHCIELPEHLKYQLQVAQSQVGVYSKAQISNSEIERFNQEINIKKNSTYLMIGFQALMIPGVGKAGMSMFGFVSRGALKRLALVGGAESEALVSEMSQLSLKDLTREQGLVDGTHQYILQKIAAVKAFGRMNILGSAASNQGLRELLTSNAVEVMAEEPSALSHLYEARVEAINVEGARLIRVAEKTTLIGKDRGAKWWATAQMKQWVKNRATEIGFKNTKYWKMVVSDNALDAMLTGKLLAGANSDSEIRAMVIYAYARDLMHERDYLIGAKYKLDMWLNSGALEGPELLKQHFRVFGDSDWARHEQLFNWAAKHTDKPLLARINLKWSAKTLALGKMHQAFKDYRTLKGELDLVSNRFWNWEADEYFAHEAPEANDISVDENGYEIIKPRELPPQGGTFTEILFDPSGLLPQAAN